MSSYGVREGSGAGEWIMGAATRNPEGLLLLAAGCALLMRNGRSQSPRRSYAESFPSRGGERRSFDTRENDKTGIGERVGEAARRAGEYVSEATDKVSETARSYAASAAEYTDEAAQIAAERSRRVADQARDTADYIVREQPWAVALAGLAAGAAVAAAFPSTRIERRTLGEVGESLRSRAGSIGEQLMETGRQAARDVGESFGAAIAREDATRPQASKQKQGDEGVGSNLQQPETGRTQSSKGNASNLSEERR